MSEKSTEGIVAPLLWAIMETVEAQEIAECWETEITDIREFDESVHHDGFVITLIDGSQYQVMVTRV